MARAIAEKGFATGVWIIVGLTLVGLLVGIIPSFLARQEVAPQTHVAMIGDIVQLAANQPVEWYSSDSSSVSVSQTGLARAIKPGEARVCGRSSWSKYCVHILVVSQ